VIKRDTVSYNPKTHLHKFTKLSFYISILRSPIGFQFGKIAHLGKKLLDAILHFKKYCIYIQ